jgi:hypothetical protein
MHPITYLDLECTFRPFIERAPPAYFVLHKAVAQSGWAVVIGQTVGFTNCVWPGPAELPLKIPPRGEMYQVDNAIVVFHPFSSTYGHIVGEVMPQLLAIPAEIWAKSVFFVCKGFLKQVASELLELCGRKPIAIRNLWRSVFAQNLYVGRPWLFMEIWADAIRAMRQKVFRTLGLPRGRPEMALVVQRSRNRIIDNIDNLWSAVTAGFPRGKWFLLTEKGRSITQQVLLHANTSLLIMVSGSGGANAIWMQRNSVMIEIQVRKCVAVLSEMARVAGVKVFETGSRRLDSTTVTVNVSVLAKLVAMARVFMKDNPPGDKL